MTEYLDVKYYCSKETLKETLNKFGVAIIPNVLNENECTSLVNGIWNYFEHITQEWEIPIKKDNPNSWKEFYKLYPTHAMLIQHWDVGHTQVSWDVRQNEKIVDIFSHFWNCDKNELLVSFDGLSFNLPPEITKRGWNKNNTWYHTDQSFTVDEFKCIQSWVTGIDVNDGDATLSFMEGSNKYHKEFRKNFNITDKSNWYKLTKEQEQFYLSKNCLYKNIKCPKGSLVLWDSRTIHCGVEALRNREKPNLRAIIYLCYMPRELSTQKLLEKKQKAFQELRTTSHWANKPALFPKNPRTYGNELPTITKINQPNLTDLGKKLAGF